MEHKSYISEEKMVDSLLQSDTFLPARYLETICRKIHLDPEKKLMLAVLEDGITCYHKYISTRDGEGKRLFGEAEEWFLMEKNGDCLFSFDIICEALGINREYIREELLRWQTYRDWGSIEAEPAKIKCEVV